MFLIFAKNDLALMMTIKNSTKSEIAAIILENIGELLITFVIQDTKHPVTKFPVVFHHGSTCDYHFIIKELAKEFEDQFKCLGGNTEKYITLSVPIKKELDNGKTITDKLSFPDSFRFMSNSLSSLADNLSEGLHNKKCIMS